MSARRKADRVGRSHSTPGANQAGAAIAIALVRAYRTGDTAGAGRMMARSPAAVIPAVLTVLTAAVAGLLGDVDDDRLEAAVTAAVMRRPTPG